MTPVFTFMLVLVMPHVCKRHNFGHIIMLVLLVSVAEQDVLKPVDKLLKKLPKLRLKMLQEKKLDKLRRKQLKKQLLSLMKQRMPPAPVMML